MSGDACVNSISLDFARMGERAGKVCTRSSSRISCWRNRQSGWSGARRRRRGRGRGGGKRLRGRRSGSGREGKGRGGMEVGEAGRDLGGGGVVIVISQMSFAESYSTGVGGGALGLEYLAWSSRPILEPACSNSYGYISSGSNDNGSTTLDNGISDMISAFMDTF